MADIEKIRAQLSMRDLPNSGLRFALEVSFRQRDITLEAVREKLGWMAFLLEDKEGE